MKRRILWGVVSGWMVAALLLASCAPAAEQPEKKATPPKEEVPREVVVPKEEVVPKEVAPKGGAAAEMVKWTKEKWDGTIFEKMMEKPRYGGTYVYGRADEPVVWDTVKDANAWPSEPTNERLAIQHDWARGPAGTGEIQMMLHIDTPFSFAPMLATGYDIPDDHTIVYHIRKGVRWQNKPPVNGRAFTPADVVSNYVYMFKPGSFGRTRGPLLTDPDHPENSISISPDNPWDVVLKVQPGMVPALFMAAGCHRPMYPPEVIEKYGDMNDWRNVVGTGPFMVKDYVGGSAVTYVRNPDYWELDPWFQKDQLPYIDTLKVLIIPDSSTRLAAMRTGKIDSLINIPVEDAEPVIESNPEIQWVQHLADAQQTIFMRMDKPDKPWADVRVRRALMMAIDNFEMRDVYYKGKAELFQFPVYPVPEWKDVYIPFEEFPDSVKEMFEYHPDKAKKLLAEAGYPNGFKATIIVNSQPSIDLMSIVKEYWSAIGVDLQIEAKDFVQWTTQRNRKSYTDMVFSTMTSASIYQMTYYRAGSGPNYSNIDDPFIAEAYARIVAAMPGNEWRRLFREEVVPYVYDQMWWTLLPSPWQYNLWQPWLKNFEGANRSHVANLWWPKYLWVDQELKAKMGH